MDLTPIIDISHRYGADPDWVLAGGGNTSQKTTEILAIKASGHALADIDANGFVSMDRSKLAAIWQAEYPEDTKERETRALADLMAARLPGDTDKRPSVETLMHDLFPQRLVLHTHPSLVNGLTCSKEGLSAAQALFGDSLVWIPVVNPGYVLARTIRDSLSEYKETTGRPAAILIMENHGLVVAADTVEDIDRLSNEVVEKLRSRVVAEPDLGPADVNPEAVSAWQGVLRTALKAQGVEEPHVSFGAPRELLPYMADNNAFAPLADLGYTPDHIVYCGRYPLFVAGAAAKESAAGEDLVSEYVRRHGSAPKTVAVSGLGVFGIGSRKKAADAAVTLFLDLLKILRYAEGFGGAKRMAEDKIEFIVNWEVEQYRSKVST